MNTVTLLSRACWAVDQGKMETTVQKDTFADCEIEVLLTNWQADMVVIGTISLVSACICTSKDA